MSIRSLWFGLLFTFPLFEPYFPEYESSKGKYSNHIILMSKMTFHFNSNYKSIAKLDWILYLPKKKQKWNTSKIPKISILPEKTRKSYIFGQKMRIEDVLLIYF